MIKNTNQDKGFTLVELLIVIVILGILATVTVFAVGGIQTRAQTNACDVEEKNIQTAAAAYVAENNGSYPTGAGDLATYGVSTEATNKFAITWSATAEPVLATGPAAGAPANTVACTV